MSPRKGASLMATSFRIKAAGRSADTEAAIRDALMAGDSAEAVTVACAALRSEAKKFRERRHGDGPLADAEIAATLLFSLAGLHVHKPLRLPARSEERRVGKEWRSRA